MSMNGIGSNYCYMGVVANHVQEKVPAMDTERKVAERPTNLFISDEGRNMLREMVNKFEPDSDYVNARELTIQNTNEVAWEHYTAMRGISSQTLKDGNYNVEDVMKSIMDTYEARYNEIVKEHENGDREVSYELTGKRSLTLDEDLAGLDEAFKMRLANLEGFITCQQTNRAFENPDSSWYFNRNSSRNEGKTQDMISLLDTKDRDSAVSIMEQEREKFLAAFKNRKTGKRWTNIGGIHLPDFNDKYVFSKSKSGISDEEYRKQIEEQAYEDFAKGQFQNKSEGFNRLMKSYTSEVSPDRKGIITSGLKAVSGNRRNVPKPIDFVAMLLEGKVKYQKLPSGSSDYIEFYDKNGEMVATYSNNGWTMYTTNAEASRQSEMCMIYNEAWGNAKRGIPLAGEEAVNVEDMQNSFDAKA